MKMINAYQKASIPFKVGFWLTVVMLVLAIASNFWTSFQGFMDFPCEYSSLPHGIPLARLDIQTDTRLAYCLSWYASNMGGGGIYALGSSNEDLVTITSSLPGSGMISVERQQTSIVVNGSLLKLHETTSEEFTFPAPNPWLLQVVEFTIQNSGLLESQDIIYVSGDARAKYVLNPLGVVLLTIGLVTMLLGLRRPAQR